MIGLVDALTCYQIDRRQVHVLSLGCGDVDLRMTSGQIARSGMLHWRKIMSSAMHLQSQNAIGQTGLLIVRDQLLRITAPPRAGKALEMDNYEGALELVDTGAHLADAHRDEIFRRFLYEPAEP